MITEDVVETQYEFTQKKKDASLSYFDRKREVFFMASFISAEKNKAMKMQVVIADRNPLRAMEG